MCDIEGCLARTNIHTNICRITCFLFLVQVRNLSLDLPPEVLEHIDTFEKEFQKSDFRKTVGRAARPLPPNVSSAAKPVMDMVKEWAPEGSVFVDRVAVGETSLMNSMTTSVFGERAHMLGATVEKDSLWTARFTLKGSRVVVIWKSEDGNMAHYMGDGTGGGCRDPTSLKFHALCSRTPTPNTQDIAEYNSKFATVSQLISPAGRGCGVL